MTDLREDLEELLDSAITHVYATALPGAVKRALDHRMSSMREDPGAFGDSVTLPMAVLEMPSVEDAADLATARDRMARDTGERTSWEEAKKMFGVEDK